MDIFGLVYGPGNVRTTVMLFTWLDRFRDVGLLVLRLGIGFMFAWAHGLGKMIEGPEKWTELGGAIGALGVPVFLPAFWGFMAAFAELVGGILLAMGLLFRPAVFLLLCTMIVAAAMHLSADHDMGKVTSRPIEMAILFFSLLLIGPGRLALDSVITIKRKKK